MTEIAEMASQSEGNKISFISFISAGQKYSFVEKPVAWYNKSPTVIGFAASLVEEIAEIAERASQVDKNNSFISPFNSPL